MSGRSLLLLPDVNALADDRKNDRLFCWEQVNRTNQSFRVAQAFAARNDAERLLPLYAFFSVIDQVVSRSSDEDLALSKLGWWRMECSSAKLSSSHHPVLKEFRRTGILETLQGGYIENLLDEAESRLLARAPSDISEFQRLCVDCQTPRFNMEMAVCGLEEGEVEADTGLLARGGLLQLIRESTNRSDQNAYWWIPMNMQARHGINREDVLNQPASGEVGRLFSELIAASESWADSTKTGRRAGANPAVLRNHFAINGMYSRKINSLKRISPDRYSSELGRIRIFDVVTAWNCARRLRC